MIINNNLIKYTMGINCALCAEGRVLKADFQGDPIIKTGSLSKIIKIKSHIRKYLLIKSLQKQNPQNLKLKKKNSNKQSYQIIEKTSINQKQLEQLFLTYPPLNDNIKLQFISISYPNIAEYSGEWNPILKEKHGRGIQLWFDKKIYIGQWKNNKMNGKGKLIEPSGDLYEGEFLNDKIEGYDSYYNKKGTSYIGTWKNNLQDGKGKEIWFDKTEYEGEFKEGKKWGKGKLILNEGSFYDGDFYDNQIHGKGKFLWSDGKEYNGEFKNNKMDGEGEFKWEDGKIYKGHYFRDEKNGYGEFFWPNGKVYKGYWKNGKQNGDGELFEPDNKIWKKGFWCNGKRVKWDIIK